MCIPTRFFYRVMCFMVAVSLFLGLFLPSAYATATLVPVPYATSSESNVSASTRAAFVPALPVIAGKVIAGTKFATNMYVGAKTLLNSMGISLVAISSVYTSGQLNGTFGTHDSDVMASASFGALDNILDNCSPSTQTALSEIGNRVISGNNVLLSDVTSNVNNVFADLGGAYCTALEIASIDDSFSGSMNHVLDGAWDYLSTSTDSIAYDLPRYATYDYWRAYAYFGSYVYCHRYVQDEFGVYYEYGMLNASNLNGYSSVTVTPYTDMTYTGSLSTTKIYLNREYASTSLEAVLSTSDRVNFIDGSTAVYRSDFTSGSGNVFIRHYLHNTHHGYKMGGNWIEAPTTLLYTTPTSGYFWSYRTVDTTYTGTLNPSISVQDTLVNNPDLAIQGTGQALTEDDIRAMISATITKPIELVEDTVVPEVTTSPDVDVVVPEEELGFWASVLAGLKDILNWLSVLRDTVVALPSSIETTLSGYLTSIKEDFLAIPQTFADFFKIDDIIADIEFHLESLKERFFFIFHIKESVEGIINSLMVQARFQEPPVIYLNVDDSTDGIDWGEPVPIIDMRPFDKYMPFFRGVVACFIWISFAWMAYCSLPGIIHGSAVGIRNSMSTYEHIVQSDYMDIKFDDFDIDDMDTYYKD